MLSYSTHKRTLEYAQSQVLRSLVHLLRELSTDAQSSFDLVECGGARACVKLLRCYLHDPAASDVVHVTVEILWNVLEHCHNVTDVAGPPAASRTKLLSRRRFTSAMYQLSDDATIAVLRQILQHLFLTGHKADDILPFANLMSSQDGLYTNEEFYELVDPTNDDLPYVYDSLTYWPGCTDDTLLSR